MTIRPVGKNTHVLEFLMPKYHKTEYHGHHNHEGTVAHRFLVELSYARESTKTTPMTELAKLIHYAEVHHIQNNVVSHGHSRTYTDISKVQLYLPEANVKKVMDLIYELRYHIGVITSGERYGQKGHVFFSSSATQDYIAD